MKLGQASLVIDCRTCDNQINVELVPGEAASKMEKRVGAILVERSWAPLSIHREQIGFCCEACCRAFGHIRQLVRDADDADSAQIIAIR